MGYTPLSDTIYSPGPGEGLWVAGVFLAGMIIHGATVLWTMVLRPPGRLRHVLPVRRGRRRVLAMFSGRRFFNYTGTAFALLVFAALSMAVWGHHMFISGQQVNDYFSLTSILLTIPAGMEYFGFAAPCSGDGCATAPRCCSRSRSSRSSSSAD